MAIERKKYPLVTGDPPCPSTATNGVDITRRDLSGDESNIERVTDQEPDLRDRASSSTIYCHYSSQEERIQLKTKPDVHRTYTKYVVNIYACDSSWFLHVLLQAVGRNVFSSSEDSPFGYTSRKFRGECLYFPSAVAASMEENMQSLDCSDMDNDFEGVDLSRLPPKSYFSHDGAMGAIRKEIRRWILSPNLNVNSQEDALRIVSANDPAMPRYPKYFATLVVRKQGAAIVKSRLRIRGGGISIARSSFTSAPTADRSSVRILLRYASNLKLIVGSCHATQAILHVYDTVVADTHGEIDRFKLMVGPFRRGGFGGIPDGESLIFRGMQIS